jgi:hypothetical protein
MGNYLFLYLKTGGGHLAPAKAVAEKIKTKKRVDVEILLVDFVHLLVSISEVVITKCGASTSMEILEKNTRFLPDVLHRLLTDNEFYNSISNNIKKAAISNGVGPVSDYILKYQ